VEVLEGQISTLKQQCTELKDEVSKARTLEEEARKELDVISIKSTTLEQAIKTKEIEEVNKVKKKFHKNSLIFFKLKSLEDSNRFKISEELSKLKEQEQISRQNQIQEHARQLAISETAKKKITEENSKLKIQLEELNSKVSSLTVELANKVVVAEVKPVAIQVEPTEQKQQPAAVESSGNFVF
jgi:hypothetical protein